MFLFFDILIVFTLPTIDIAINIVLSSKGKLMTVGIVGRSDKYLWVAIQKNQPNTKKEAKR